MSMNTSTTGTPMRSDGRLKRTLITSRIATAVTATAVVFGSLSNMLVKLRWVGAFIIPAARPGSVPGLQKFSGKPTHDLQPGVGATLCRAQTISHRNSNAGNNQHHTRNRL